MKKILTIILLLILVLSLILFGTYYWYNNAINEPNSDIEASIVFEIEQGESIESIADKLLKLGLIKDKLPFIIYSKLNPDLVSKIQAGYFEIKQNTNIIDLYISLQKAKNKEDLKITIVEGLRYDEIIENISKAFESIENSNFNKEEFKLIIENPDNYSFSSEVSDKLKVYKPKGANLEGYLYPDTYFFSKDSTSIEVIEKLLLTLFNKLSNSDYLQISNSNYSFHEYLIIASMIEREALALNEEAMIADVIFKRLEKGINGVKLLQIDATLLYPVRDWKANAYLLKNKDNKYNTYKYEGLPIGPICSPGIHAIKASIYPEKNDYYYYLHDNKGVIHYAKTYSEHLNNINKYL